jgi:PPOX class probable F420-dependent enzyme
MEARRNLHFRIDVIEREARSDPVFRPQKYEVVALLVSRNVVESRCPEFGLTLKIVDAQHDRANPEHRNRLYPAFEADKYGSAVGDLTDSVRSFLGERRCAVLATHDADGRIHLTPIWFLFEDDCFCFASSSGSRKVKNVERELSASVVVDAREPGRERWVSASGPVEILRDAESQSINARIRRRYLAPDALDGPIDAALAASDDITLRLAPTTWHSWTAPIVESPERWFLAVDA